MRKLVLIDGHAILHRAYHALPPLTTQKGEMVNAVYGFSMILLRVLSEIKPDWVIGTFDKAAPTFRHTEYTAYKAHRVAAPDDLHAQLPRIQEVLNALSIPFYELDGYEADDLIGTLALQASESPKVDEVVIVTGDMDSLQLVTSKVKVYTARKGITDTVMFDETAVKERYSLTPAQIPDYKGLAGDASDNIPGVAGIGQVTAKKLLNEYGSVEGVYQNLDKQPERLRNILSVGSEQAVMSKKLATIDTHAPIKIDLEACVLKHYDKNAAVGLFQELQFKSLIPKLPESDFSLSTDTVSSDVSTPLLESVEEKEPSELQSILTEMTKCGVLVDRKVLSDLSSEFEASLKDIEHKIYASIGHELNLNSPKQLSEVLYSELGLTPGRKKKTHPSTDSDTLSSLIDAHPVIELLLQYRELFKLKSTYIDAIPTSINSEDGRVHTEWHDDVARTGRLSSTSPNLQNIPVKGDWGQKIRRAFIAPPGHRLLAGDYNQIELRVMAHLSQDPALLKIFKEGQDIHTTTAAWIFNKNPEEITKDERRVAKTVNFGVLYLMSPYGLSRSLKIDPKVAAEFIERYYARFAKVKEYQEKILQRAKDQGYLETITGFKRYFLELQSANYMVRSSGERMASNFPVQGSAADIIKQAMVNIHKRLKKEKLVSKMILQVHDELVFEVPDSELQILAPLIKEEMEQAFKLSVPLVVELKQGTTWGDMSGMPKS
ncbi:MAG: hypothetical protein A3A61_01910 [Candidatus Woykebacteria bacterium RIFCSPLOWO2_01_FULL_43_14]|nr:MAG: hypothetical protein A3A61_01910 [Candidatus Woykebacteria bacterium RIFCSPLOWO2_01_FULL_43_14]